MNATLRRLLPLVLMAGSSLAFASGHLTREECNSYPFKPAHGPLTQADVAREMAELESVGYRPAIDNYSPDISAARDRLGAEYARDCMPRQHAAGGPSNNG
ncbi:DUF4148 domain-containing protein [Paraburkholderia ferrariae]|jgi:hypothetical protein|uniref:DUF4148 domain-containing protein n=1 Tax=Paraburkholderia ferrariae TaxID=386056 RepID=UPI0005AB14F0|nr:DUF4148 domain-containing protein [Paraburkholderia ferrariae]